MKTRPVEDIILEQNDRWENSDNLKETHLLRLGILRTIVLDLHSEKSRCLAAGLKADAKALTDWEVRIENLRESSSLEGDLLAAIQNANSATKRKRMPPEGLFQFIERDKLNRYDRTWENTIASVAATIQWRFWSLEAWVEIAMIEEWNKSFEGKLWPHGIILFTESMDQTTPTELSASSINEAIWRGRWIFVLNSQFSSAEEIPVNLENSPGMARKPPHPAVWKCIYPS